METMAYLKSRYPQSHWTDDCLLCLLDFEAGDKVTITVDCDSLTVGLSHPDLMPCGYDKTAHQSVDHLCLLIDFALASAKALDLDILEKVLEAANW